MRTRFLSRFTPSLMSPEALEAIFVQREPLVQEVLEQLRRNTNNPSKRHILLVGPRGLGKTHLISLIYYRVLAIKDISDRTLVAWLREEEWGITCLRDFLIRILRALQAGSPDDPSLKERIESLHHLAPDRIESAAGEILRGLVGERTLLLLVENLDELFQRLGAFGQVRLFSFLRQNPFFSIVATSPTFFTDLRRPGSPFTGFFEVRQLQELTLDDATRLMIKIARYEGNDDLAAFIAVPRGRARLRALRYLAGGNHRAYVIFSQLLARESLDDLMEPLMRTIDDLTPYYHSRIAALSPDQRKVIELICENYHPLRISDVASGCFLTPENASTLLESLAQMGHLHALGVGREKYYELREPLMRLSIEVKKHRGKPIRLLLDFLRLWYSPAELSQRLALLPPDAELERGYAQPALQVGEKDWQDPRLSECCKEYEASVARDDYVRALQAAEELVAIRGHVEDLSAQAVCLARLGRQEEAAALYDKLVEAAPSQAQIWRQRAWTLSRAGRLEDALASCGKSLELDSSSGHSWCCRGSLLIDLGRADEAVASCDEAIKLNGKDSLAWTTRGKALAELGCYDEASAAFAKVVELTPESAPGYHYLCASLIELKRFDEALSEAKRAIGLESRNPVAWVLQGIALAGCNRHEEALISFDKAVELGEDSSLVHYKRAELLLVLGQWRAGASLLDETLGRFAHSKNPDAGNTAALIRQLFSILYSPKTLQLCIKVLVILYRKHKSLSALGHGLTECIPEAGSPELFSEAAPRLWLSAWEAAAGGLPEFRLPLRFLELAVRYRETHDLRLFMELSLEERTFLESMIGVRVQVTA